MMNNRTIPDSHQNFWEIASIQVGSMGVPGMFFLWQVAKEYGPGNAIGASFIGNLILWVIGLVVISMSTQNRTDAIANFRQHLGKSSALFTAIIIMLSYQFWASIQLQSSVDAVETVLKIHSYVINDNTVRIGAGIGIWGSLLAIGGIRMVKWLNVICLPLLLSAQIYLLVTSDHSQLIDDLWGFSLPAITSVVLLNIQVTMFLPTFFRHSRSLADSYLALTLIAILNIFFQVSSIWIGFDNLLPSFQNSNAIFLFLIIAFIVLLAVCNLLINIYYASISLEAMMPNFDGFKEYAIIGLSGTVTYLFIQVPPPMFFMENLATDFIAILSVALSITYLVQTVVKRRPISFGKLVGSASWFIGCVSVIILNFQNGESNAMHLYISMGICVLFFLSTLFLEEMLWALRKLYKKEAKSKQF
ncbi:MAG: hypothetical protein HW387_765 [Parachlamydiales bacterium]|nr:hypothetical protein [Parachlamydiales bacterium]